VESPECMGRIKQWRPAAAAAAAAEEEVVVEISRWWFGYGLSTPEVSSPATTEISLAFWFF